MWRVGRLWIRGKEVEKRRRGNVRPSTQVQVLQYARQAPVVAQQLEHLADAQLADALELEELLYRRVDLRGCCLLLLLLLLLLSSLLPCVCVCVCVSDLLCAVG